MDGFESTLFPAYPAIKRALVKEENDLFRPMSCYVFFFRGSLPERNPKIPGVIFFIEKNYHIFKWGSPFQHFLSLKSTPIVSNDPLLYISWQ